MKHLFILLFSALFFANTAFAQPKTTAATTAPALPPATAGNPAAAKGAVLPPAAPAKLPASTLSPEKQAVLDDELIYRTTFGRADDVAILIKEGANPNTVSSYGWPALSIAASRRDAEALGLVKVLVSAGADVNKSDINKNYPLLYAAKNNDLQMTIYLLEHKADMFVQTPEGHTAQDIARTAGFKEILKVYDAIEEKRRKEYAAKRSPDRYNRLLYDLAYTSCSYQYYSYYYASKQDPIPPEKAKRNLDILANQITTSRTLLVDLFHSRGSDLDAISKTAMQQVAAQLDTYISNRNRRANGVGKPEDMDKRCKPIAMQWQPVQPKKDEKSAKK